MSSAQQDEHLQLGREKARQVLHLYTQNDVDREWRQVINLSDTAVLSRLFGVSSTFEFKCSFYLEQDRYNTGSDATHIRDIQSLNRYLTIAQNQLVAQGVVPSVLDLASASWTRIVLAGYYYHGIALQSLSWEPISEHHQAQLKALEEERLFTNLHDMPALQQNPLHLTSLTSILNMPDEALSVQVYGDRKFLKKHGSGHLLHRVWLAREAFRMFGFTAPTVAQRHNQVLFPSVKVPWRHLADQSSFENYDMVRDFVAFVETPIREFVTHSKEILAKSPAGWFLRNERMQSVGADKLKCRPLALLFSRPLVHGKAFPNSPLFVATQFVIVAVHVLRKHHAHTRNESLQFLIDRYATSDLVAPLTERKPKRPEGADPRFWHGDYYSKSFENLLPLKKAKLLVVLAEAIQDKKLTNFLVMVL
ncbi:hypothetical protein ACM66B_003186 [Microbotryomycetes sp. NB124-2]